MTKNPFPKTIYVTISDEDPIEYYVDTNKEFIKDEEADIEVAVYQLVKVGTLKKSYKLVFDA